MHSVSYAELVLSIDSHLKQGCARDGGTAYAIEIDTHQQRGYEYRYLRPRA